MKMKTIAGWLPVLAAAYLFAAAAPPVYPGAKAVDELNDAAKTTGQNTMSYNTMDSFEKVFDFYNSKGAEVQRAHRDTPKEKFAMFMFQDAGARVAISWKSDAKDKGTVIHISKR